VYRYRYRVANCEYVAARCTLDFILANNKIFVLTFEVGGYLLRVWGATLCIIFSPCIADTDTDADTSYNHFCKIYIQVCV